MKNRFLFFAAFLITTISFAQKNSINGLILDNANLQPIEFASISLMQEKDSAIIAGTLTTKDGSFNLTKINNGNYILQVFCIGYTSVYRKINLTNTNQTVKLDRILLQAVSKKLEDVVVSGKKQNITNKLDKQTYKATQFEAAKGGNATDILKNLPSVSVNSAGEISVRGATGFLILINGKPVVTDAATILNQLPANSIESIELITAPSAKLDADGKAGIINIVTKKGSNDGLGVVLNVMGGLPSTTNYNNLENPVRFSGDVTVNLRQKKWDIIFSANYNRNDANGQRDGDVFTRNFTNNTITRFPSFGERSFDRYNYGARTAVTFNADKQNIFNAGLFLSKRYQQRRADIVYNNSTSNITNGAVLRQLTYFNSNLQNKEGNFALASFDYTHIFDNKSSITTAVIYESADLYGNTINQNLDFPAKSNIFQLVTNPYTNPISGYRIKLDYSTKIGKGKLETGYQFRRDKQNGNFEYNVTPATNQPDIALFRGKASSINLIHGVYAQYAGSIDKLQYIAGVRYENAARTVTVSSAANDFELDLNNLFPSLNLAYAINNNWNLKGGYSKRIQRNNNFELNPIPEREHSETLEQGDPNLQPQFIDLAEIGFNHNFKNGSFFSTVYYQHIKNPIQRVNSVYADTILNRLFTNAGAARLWGLEMGANIKPTKWLTTYLGANIYNYKISGRLNVLGNVSTINNADWVYSINVNNSADLGKQLMLQANINYLSARPTAQGKDTRFFSPNTSVKKTFKNGKYSIGLQWQQMNLGFMQSNQQRITTWGTDFYTTTNYIYETDTFQLNFSINLNKLFLKYKIPVSEMAEKEF